MALGFFFDPLYLLFLAPGLILTLWAQAKVKGTVNRWSEVPNTLGLTGAEVAHSILELNNIHDVRIEQTPGYLSDHYDSRHKVLRLSPGNFSGRSVAAAGIAAHEVGHAIQHASGYAPLWVRQLLARPAAVGQGLSMYLILAGFFFSQFLINVGIVLFSLAVVFTLVTLPVEFNASSRAKALLPEVGFTGRQEADGVKACLNAAAMTYVAAAAVAVMQLLYLIIRFSSARE